MLKTKTNQKGATMIETLGVLTIVIVLSTSAISLIANIWGLFKQYMVVHEIRDLQKSITEAYKADGNYNALLSGWSEDNYEVVIQRLCNGKIAPYEMCSGGRLYHRQGGSVWVLPYVNGSNVQENDKYKISVMHLTNKTCIALTETNWFLQKKPDIYQMVINPTEGGGTVIDLPQNTAGTGVNLYTFSASDAMSHCNNGDDNEVQLVFF